MVAVEELDILVGASVDSAIANLERLADSLLDVAEAQALVDERMRIRISVNDHELDQAAAKLGGFAGAQAVTPETLFGSDTDSQVLGRETAEAVADGAGQAFRGDSAMSFRRRFFGVDEPSIDEAFDMPGPFDRRRRGGILGGLGRLSRAVTIPDDGGGPIQRFARFASGFDASTLHNLIASLVPMLVTFIGALPAAIAGVVALGGAALAAAAALGGIVALGALGLGIDASGEFSMDELTSTIEDVREGFLEAFGPLARQLAPLMEQGLDGLERFFDELAARGDVLTAFSDDAIAFGAFLADGLVSVLTDAVALADAASGAFARLGAGLDSSAFVESLAEIIVDTLPELIMFGSVLLDVLPAIIELSAGFLFAAAATISFIDVVATLVGTLLTLNGVIPLELVGALLGLFLSAVTITALWVQLNALLAGTWVASIIPAISSAVTSIFAYIQSTLGATAATWAWYASLAAVVGLFTFGVLPAIAGAVSGLGQMNSKLSGAMQRLERFQAPSGQFPAPTGGAGTGGGGDSVFVDVTTTVESTGDSTEDGRLARKAAFHNKQALDSTFGGN